MSLQTVTTDLAGRALTALARFDAAPAVRKAGALHSVEWVEAWFDSGDLDGAAAELTALIREYWPAAAADQIARLDGERGVAFARVAIDQGIALREADRGSAGGTTFAAVLAPLVAGVADLEEALLRSMLDGRTSRVRERAISEAVAALAEAHTGAPEHLDRWAPLFGEQDMPRLAAAAALLGPLGLAETDRRCRTVLDVDGVRLVSAFLANDRYDDAVTLAVRLGANAQQKALLVIGGSGPSPQRAKALVAAFRKCPKRSRDRNDQVLYQHRFARLLLELGRFDEALALLVKMRDCRYHRHGPAHLSVEMLRWLEQRPAEATGDRVRAVLDVLVGPNVISQELADVVIDAVRLALASADEPLRAEITDVYLPRLRAGCLRGRTELADVGVGAALVAAGDDTALDPMFVAATTGPRRPALTTALAPFAVRTGFASRDRAAFDRLMCEVAPHSYALNPIFALLDAETRATIATCLPSMEDHHRTNVIDRLADLAVQGGDHVLLATLVDTAPDGETAVRLAWRTALMLVRLGEPVEAVALARRAGYTID